MKRSQSSKELSRGLEDQVKDFVSQPLKSLNLFTELLKRIQLQEEEKHTIVVSEGLQKEKPGGSKKYTYSESYSWRSFLSQEQIDIAQKATTNKSKPFFNNSVIREFAEQLQGDSFECYSHMYDIRYLENQGVLNHYSKIFGMYKTVPVVFLSIVKTQDKKIKAIYFWQFNESCPVNRKTSNMEVDCPPHKQILVPHSSMLLLAKFMTSENEELLDGQFLSDSRILIKSKVSGGAHLRFREYDMMDLRELVKINPYDSKVDNRFYCASKLDISVDEETKNELDCDLSRIRRLMEIDLLEYYSAHKKEGLQSLPMFLNTESQKIVGVSGLEDSSFSEIYSTKRSGYTVLIDKALLKMVLFKKDSLKIIDLKTIGEISLIYENKNDVLYFLNSGGKAFIIGEDFQVEELIQIQVESLENVKFSSASDCLVYLEGTKFYSIALKKGASPQYLFDVEEVKIAEEEQVHNYRKFIWEVVLDNIIFIRGISTYFYDMTLKRFERREFDNIELLEYKSKSVGWKFAARNNKLFVIRSIQDLLKIDTLTVKSKPQAIQQDEINEESDEDIENDDDDEEEEIEPRDSPKRSVFWTGELRKTEDKLFTRVTGPDDNIIFLRLEDPYLKDEAHEVSDIPNYLFSSFVFPPKKQQQQSGWQDYYRRQEKEREEKRREEYKKKLLEDAKDFEEFEEMKVKVNKHLKDGKVRKDEGKYQEERKERMADLRKAIVKSGKEEGADRADKRLKDVKEDYMSMYQDLKKEKKQQNKEKERNKNKDRKNDRSQKREEY